MSAQQIQAGQTSLGIEFGSTVIKACLIGPNAEVLATGTHEWQNRLEDGHWTYSLDDVEQGLAAAHAALVSNVGAQFGVTPTRYGAIGVSAMMHGYLAFNAADELLVPFRTWRDTTTSAAAAELSELFGVNIPLRWSIAHLHQAVLDAEPHVGEVAWFTTLAGYVHWRLTGERVLGVGDASGMFPIDSATGGYDATMLAAYDALSAGRIPAPLRTLLPAVLPAGTNAGSLTTAGAALLDPSGVLQAGTPLCPPEGDAGTGMVATNAIAPRTGNVSAGTSIFAMVVLQHPLAHAHHEIDLVTTPVGDPVAMVHCNNGASELGAWAKLFGRFAEALGADAATDDVYRALLTEALAGEADAGGVVAYNFLAGEPVVGLTDGRPVVARTPESNFSLANFMRAQVYGVFATLALGMRILHDEGAALETMYAHGGIFRTAGVAQRFLAAALDAPVAVNAAASEGGAWGIAVLAAYLERAETQSLAEYLTNEVFAGVDFTLAEPQPDDVTGFAAFLNRYETALAIQHAAIASLN